MRHFWLLFFYLRVSLIFYYLPSCTGYRKRECSMFLISSSTTSIIFRTWWVVGIVFGTENINYLAKLLDWLIRNGWLNAFRSRGGIGYLQRRVKPYVLRKRLCAMSLCRCDVIYGGSRGNWRFLSAKLDYLCYAIFRPSVCFLDATILMFSAILTVVWKRFSLIDMCWLTPEARTVLSCGAGERSRGSEVLDINL